MSGGGGGGEAEQSGPRKNVFGETTSGNVDLNLTALMDILSNLLFFLLASFGATIVMAINGAVPVQSPDKSDVADTKGSITLNMKLAATGIDVGASGTGQTDADLDKLRRSFPNVDGKPDYQKLREYLIGVKQTYPKSDTVILTPELGVTYETMIKTMDTAREAEVKAGFQVHIIRLFPTVVVSSVVK